MEESERGRPGDIVQIIVDALQVIEGMRGWMTGSRIVVRLRKGSYDPSKHVQVQVIEISQRHVIITL